MNNILKDVTSGEGGRNVQWTTDYRVELPITLNAIGPGSEQPVTVSEIFTRTALTKGNYPALSVRKNGKWVTKNYS